MIKIRYSSSSDITSGICYVDNLISELYLDVDVGKPKYVYSEDGDEDKDGDFIRTFARTEKQYSITTYLQEYMIDAVFAIQLHDNIEVLLSNGTILPIKEFRVSEPEWGEAEGMASVTMTFIVYTETSRNQCSSVIDCGINTPTLTAMSKSPETGGCLYIITGGGCDDNVFIEIFMKVGISGTWVSKGTITSAQYNGSGTKAYIHDDCYAESVFFKVGASRWGCAQVFSSVYEVAP